MSKARFELQHRPGAEFPWVIWDNASKEPVAQFEPNSEERARSWMRAFEEEKDDEGGLEK